MECRYEIPLFLSYFHFLSSLADHLGCDTATTKPPTTPNPPATQPQMTVEITSKVTVTPTNSPSDGGGLSRSDQIALGVGIGIGLPATLAGLVLCYVQIVRGR